MNQHAHDAPPVPAPNPTLLNPPSHWRKLEPMEFPKGTGNIAARCWHHSLIPITVLRSLSRTSSGIWWIHLSLSRRDRVPSWDEIKKVALDFLGDRTAMHVVAKGKDHINIHPNCFHLWALVNSEDEGAIPNLQNITWEVGI